MLNAIIVHGRPSKNEYYDPKFPSASNYHWLPWLQNQLLIHDIAAATPEMPHAFEPDYIIWKQEFERYDILPKTILVGHSTGASFVVRWLSEQRAVAVGKVVLVAPSLHLNRKDDAFYDFTIDPKLAQRTKGLVIFYAPDDSQNIVASVQILAQTIPGTTVREFPGYGHFTHLDMKTNEFPELIKELLA